MGSAPPPGYRPQTAYAPPPQPDRGFFERIIGEPNVADMTARMASYSFGKDGQFTVTLANGQIWKQISDEPLARWSRPAASYSVTIKPGAFHTFNLIVDDEAQVFKVKRIH
jgi:hypothetical protein